MSKKIAVAHVLVELRWSFSHPKLSWTELSKWLQLHPRETMWFRFVVTPWKIHLNYIPKAALVAQTIRKDPFKIFT